MWSRWARVPLRSVPLDVEKPARWKRCSRDPRALGRLIVLNRSIRAITPTCTAGSPTPRAKLRACNGPLVPIVRRMAPGRTMMDNGGSLLTMSSRLTRGGSAHGVMGPVGGARSVVRYSDRVGARDPRQRGVLGAIRRAQRPHQGFDEIARAPAPLSRSGDRRRRLAVRVRVSDAARASRDVH